MKSKKISSKRLNFYSISNEYIKYISEFDSHIAYNKNNKRPYVGIVLYINNLLYFAPLFSPKPQHFKYKDNLSFIKLYGNNEKTDYLGLIRFADMIPVPECEITKIDGSIRGKKYNMLLIKQYNYINENEKRELIKTKAKNIYDIVTSNNSSRTAIFYKKICCNYKILEEKCLRYEKIINNK